MKDSTVNGSIIGESGSKVEKNGADRHVMSVINQINKRMEMSN